MVVRPRVWFMRARSTASRMSLTPDSTAEMAMKSAPKACAVSRASVVLPTPGGPHRIIECSLPESNASRSGLPAPSRCVWPTTSARLRGRNRSASGARGSRAGSGASVGNRSCGHMARIIPLVSSGRRAISGGPPCWPTHHSPLTAERSPTAPRSLANHIRPLRRREGEARRRDARVAHEVRQLERGAQAEVVEELHLGQHVALEAHADALECGVLGLRDGFQPLEPAGLPRVLQAEVLLDGVIAGEERRRSAGDHVAEPLHGDLVEVRIVEPQLHAVADDDLFVRLVVVPAELAWTSEGH